jgi:transposase
LSEQGHIDLFYGDESGVSLLPCVPYGWQFSDEQAGMPSTRGPGVNCFALLSRHNDCWFRTTAHKVTATTVVRWLDEFAQSRRALHPPHRLTVVVLDNASVHQAKGIRRCLKRWEKQGLYVFFLPTYSPHLNLAEILWRKLKYEWLQARDYADRDTLCLRVWLALAAVGKSLHIHFAGFKTKSKNSAI